MSPTSLLPREALERAARLVELVLGSTVVAWEGDSGDPPPREEAPAGGTPEALGLRVCVVPEGLGSVPLLCADTNGAAAPAGISYGRSRAFAVFPLAPTASPGIGPTGAGFGPAFCVLSDAPHEWTERETSGLSDVAATVAVELGMRRQLAERELREEELRESSLRDALTGLPNRSLFLDRLAHAVERGKRHKDFRFAVLSLDLDRFKAVNDSLGHEVGNTVLVAVARRLLECVRGEDLVARLSSDEFAVLLESLADDSDGGRVAERIQRALAEPVSTDEGEVFTSASIGIILNSSDAVTPPQLLQRAGIALSRAKAAGRARYEMFDREMHARALARLRTETDLRRAVDRGEFEIYYQPLITLSTGRITELEALVRWRHPGRGIVAPLDFIPLSEETGLILPIGAWVLSEACRQVLDWQHRFPRPAPLALSVNLSVKQLNQPHFVARVAEIVHAAGFDLHSLKLEITESFAIDNAELTRAMLEELRTLGVRIYLDDFGTGYSSLGYLQRLPLDAIKIDRSFVMHMDAGPTHFQLVHTVRELARNIGVAAVAEGVETEGQLRALRELGCESAQGYLFSRPLPPGEIEKLLADDPRW